MCVCVCVCVCAGGLNNALLKEQLEAYLHGNHAHAEGGGGTAEIGGAYGGGVAGVSSAPGNSGYVPRSQLLSERAGRERETRDAKAPTVTAGQGPNGPRFMPDRYVGGVGGVGGARRSDSRKSVAKEAPSGNVPQGRIVD